LADHWNNAYSFRRYSFVENFNKYYNGKMTGEEILFFFTKAIGYGLLFGCFVGFLSYTKYFR